MSTSPLIARAARSLEAMDDERLRTAGIHDPSQLYVPVVTYPAMSRMSPASADELLADAPDLTEPVAFYAHIPFCITRCLFCHWVIKLDSDDDEVARYLDGLDRELTMYCERFGRERIRVSSILVGGGTPSLLKPHELARFLEILHGHLDVSECTQFSYEAEPSTLLGDVGSERLELLHAAGVNRMSIGVQSFEDDLLRQNGRHHSAAEALESIEQIHGVGIESVSIDLIYGLTGQDVSSWIDTMQTAVTSGADSWQLYRLRIAPHGDRPGKVEQHADLHPEDYSTVDDTLLMKMLGILISEDAGFHQHYTRIFARSEAHISQYLYDVNARLRDVLGIGISSWGNVGNRYLLNVGNDFARYFESVEHDRLPIDRGMKRDETEEARHSFILQLKNAHVDKALFEARLGRAPEAFFADRIDELTKLDLLEETDEAIVLTDRGRFYADQVVSQFASDDFYPSVPPRPVTLGAGTVTSTR